MKTGDLARLFGVSPSTIQNWGKEFEEYLSSQKGKHRSFTEDDILILATVATLSVDGLNYEAIRKRLDNGYRVKNPSEANFGVDTRMVPAAAVEQIVDATGLRVELEQLRAERDKLADLLEKAEQRETTWQQKYDDIQQRFSDLQTQMAEVQRALGRAEGELEYRRQLDEKRRDD